MSIKKRLLIYFSGFLLFLSAFNFLYYPYILEDYALETLDAKVKRLADMLALGVGTALDSQNFNAVNATLKFAKEDPEFAFAVIFDENDEELVRINPFKLDFQLQTFLEKKGRIKLKDHLFYVSPISVNGNDYGHLILGIGLEGLRSTISHNRWTTLGVCSGIFLMGFLFTNVLSKSIIRPLNNPIQVINDMIQGKFEQSQVPVKSKDEVGKLAQAFNNFLEQIRCFVRQAREMAAGRLDVQEVHSQMAEGRDFDQAAGFVKHEYEITKGPLREAFEDLTKQMRKLAVQAEIIAHNDLYNDRLKDEETGTLGESMATMVKNLRIHISKMAQTDSLMQQLPTLVMCADNQLNLPYLNPASRKFLEAFKTYLPVPVDQLIGQSLDLFHKDPTAARKTLMMPKNLPHRAQLQLGKETIELEAPSLFDDKGDYLGPMVTWNVIREKVLMMDKEKTQNEMMKGVMTQIRENAHTLASASEEFSVISKQMVANSEKTSSQANLVAGSSQEISKNVQTLTASSEKISASFLNIAQNSKDAAHVAAKAVEMVEIAMETKQGSSEISLNIQDVATLAANTNEGANDSLNGASELAKLAAELQAMVAQEQCQT